MIRGRVKAGLASVASERQWNSKAVFQGTDAHDQAQSIQTAPPIPLSLFRISKVLRAGSYLKSVALNQWTQSPTASVQTVLTLFFGGTTHVFLKCRPKPLWLDRMNNQETLTDQKLTFKLFQ